MLKKHCCDFTASGRHHEKLVHGESGERSQILLSPASHRFLSPSRVRTTLCGARLSAQPWTLPGLKTNGFASACGILCGPWDGSCLCQTDVCVRMESVLWDLVLLLWSETETTGRQGLTLQLPPPSLSLRFHTIGFSELADGSPDFCGLS